MSADLFGKAEPVAPLADALRPKSLDEVVGQEHLIGPGKPLRLAFESGRPHSMILFVDEVHRFNKAQQDAFLPFVEQGLITFVGATTENPSFEVNSALLSRATVYVLEPLSAEDLSTLLSRTELKA